MQRFHDGTRSCLLASDPSDSDSTGDGHWRGLRWLGAHCVELAVHFVRARIDAAAIDSRMGDGLASEKDVVQQIQILMIIIIQLVLMKVQK